MSRGCGPCQACCTWLKVPELPKDAGKVCEHLCHSGCGIYDQRPRSCRKFECLWLKGELPEEARPDKIGVIFAEAAFRIKDQISPVLAVETREGAADDPLPWSLIQDYNKNHRRVVIAPPTA